MPPIMFWLNWLMVWVEMSFEEFQDGRHGSYLGYRNITILAILNLICCSVASDQVSAQYDLRFGRRSRLNNFKMAAMGAILDIQQNDFRNSVSLCHCDDAPPPPPPPPPPPQPTTHQVFGSNWLIVWEEMSFEEFQDGGHLGYRNRTILAIQNLHVATMPPNWLPRRGANFNLLE